MQCIEDQYELCYELVDGNQYVVKGIRNLRDAHAPVCVSIPAEYGRENLPVTGICREVFKGCKQLIEIVIPENVTFIGEDAFSACTSLRKITLPKSLTKIGDGAFLECKSIKEIDIPGAVTCIQPATFKDCTQLSRATIGVGVTAIREYAFCGCRALENISIPVGVKYIGDFSFSDCKSLIHVELPEVTHIGRYAFYGCTSLLRVGLCDDVTQIMDGAFEDCTHLVNVDIPFGVEIIGENSFKNCSALTTVKIADAPRGTRHDTGVPSNFNYDDEHNIQKKVKKIGAGAFVNCKSLKNVNIPSGVDSIGSYAFAGCSQLSSITVPEGVKYIGNSAFSDCTSIESINFKAIDMKDLSKENGVFHNAGLNKPGITVKIGKQVIRIPAYLFCPHANSFNAPQITRILFEGVEKDECKCESIGSYSFAFLNYLNDMVIPNSIKSMSKNIFYKSATFYTRLYYRGAAREWNSISFGVGRKSLANTILYYYSEKCPRDTGEHWHYDLKNGNVIIWRQNKLS